MGIKEYFGDWCIHCVCTDIGLIRHVNQINFMLYCKMNAMRDSRQLKCQEVLVV